MVAGLLLAAGAGRRFGRPKALVELDGEPLVRHGVRLLGDGGCAPVHVVLGAGADEMPDLPGAVPVRHDRWADGLGGSLLRGLASLPADTLAALVVLVDQPLLSPVAVRRVRRAHASGAVVAVATYAGRRGHPILLSRPTWPLLHGYAVGDRGARDLLRDWPDLVVEVPCDDVGSPADVDTPADLLRLRGSRRAAVRTGQWRRSHRGSP
ncbi:nucleotidyltransferase family protein [Micromonospora chokoriensis]|uniref:Nicotine blue oxidoreductase n=1 Tax=Micromonospora chokoriensis TaxID=356851 RepID=A0A1C4XXB0_9ACTN|nr:nucleotidyltransferase family protein [Micromonospora chokoriensis]SCF13085.1 nicotine blue oxidoreductase [Micromonospora chokoriensis]